MYLLSAKQSNYISKSSNILKLLNDEIIKARQNGYFKCSYICEHTIIYDNADCLTIVRKVLTEPEVINLVIERLKQEQYKVDLNGELLTIDWND